jgi:ABC-2 type transport system ATP-binding protein
MAYDRDVRRRDRLTRRLAVTTTARAVAFAAPPTTANAVVLQGLTKSFTKQRGWRAVVSRNAAESVRALSDVSVEIRSGEFFGLLGENGAGKTTLFKILATLVTPDVGTATVSGFDILRSPNRVREVLAPVIADERSLHWRLSGRENMRLFASLHGLRGAEATRRIDELLTLVNLVEAADRLVNGFSSGMKQRLLVARTLLARPSVLLLDEPTRSLDPISARSFRRFLREDVALAQGCTVLLATHNAEEAFELCDRVGVLHRGRLVATGATPELAREVGEDRFAIWIRPADQTAIDTLAARGVIREVKVAEADAEGWSRIECDLRGGLDGAAEAIAFLSLRGVSVARCEPVKLSLADLLERVLARHANA